MRSAALSAVLALAAWVAFADDTLFVRTSSDGQQTEIGSRGSAARTHAVRFTVTETELGRWPEPVTVAISRADASAKWSVSIPSKLAVKPHTVMAPAGSYQFTFSAPHYRTARRSVTLSSDQNLSTVSLTRNPMITGTVRTHDGSPVVGALITDRGKLATHTEPTGVFELEIPADWPQTIELSYPGLATREIEIPKAQASVRLPQITMVKGSRLTIEAEGVTGEVDAELARERGYKRFETLRTAHLKKGAYSSVFEDVEPGKYALLLRGEGPLQRASTNVDVDRESVRAVAHIEPIALTISVHKGQAPVSGALVAVQAGKQWSPEMSADDSGRITTEAWQGGALVFAVKPTATSTPVMLFKSIDSVTKEASVQLDLPSHEIAGRVIDANGGSPIANATVEVDSTNDDGSGGKLTVQSDADGTFHVDDLHDGAHEVFALADNYSRSETSKFRLDDSAPNRQLTIRMSQGLGRTLHVLNQAGWPIVNAMVVESVNGSLSDILKSDETGKVTLRAPASARVAAYVVPHEGSFAIAHLAGDENDKTVTVPDGSASLEIHAKDTQGKPIPHMSFVMWYDGELIPPDIVDVLSMQRDLAPVTGNDGVARMDRLPPGYFQFWPVRTKQEVEDVVAANGGISAPVQVSLKPGLNSASLTFSRRP